MITYAQNGEDIILERLLRETKAGFYVDVGAWDPTVHSVTRHFYDRGWRGVNIEPIGSRLALFVRDRSRDVNLQLAIGPSEGSLVFHECEEESYLSTLSEDVAAGMRRRGLTLRSYNVKVAPLSAILNEYAPDTIDFLKIDVEGFEGQVLGTLDLKRTRPRILVVEATVPASAPPDWENPEANATWREWEAAVLAAGYSFVLFDGLNRFYLRNEDAHLAKRLQLPICIFDQAERHSEAALADDVRLLRRELASRETGGDTITRMHDVRLAEVQLLRTELAARDAGSMKMSAIGAKASEEIKMLRTELAAREAGSEKLTALHAKASEEIKMLRRELAARAAGGQKLTELHTKAREEIHTLRTELAAREAGSEKLTALHAKASEEIKMLRRELAAREAGGQKLTELHTKAREEIHTLRTEMAAREAGAQKLQDLHDVRFAEAQALRAEFTARDAVFQRVYNDFLAVQADQQLKQTVIENLVAQLNALSSAQEKTSSLQQS